MPPDEPPFPNRLREVRERERMITREALRVMCERLHDDEPLLYSKVSLAAIRSLELGQSRPRARTAAAIAKVLHVAPAELFPLGPDDPRRNPEGNTRITPERRKRDRSD